MTPAAARRRRGPRDGRSASPSRGPRRSSGPRARRARTRSRPSAASWSCSAGRSSPGPSTPSAARRAELQGRGKSPTNEAPVAVTGEPLGVSEPLVGVEAEGGDVAGPLVGGVEEGPAGVEREVARRRAAGLGEALDGHRAGGVEREDDDAVVAAVRPEEPLARGVDVHLGGGVRAGEPGGEGRDGLQDGERAGGRVERELAHRARRLVDEVGDACRRGGRRCGAARRRWRSPACGTAFGVSLPVAASKRNWST